MNTIRPPSAQELAIITELAWHGREVSDVVSALSDLHVQPMSDGGMGSLLLLPRGCSPSGRMLGEAIASGEFTDIDGVPVSVTLNTDRDGQLFELDVWKADFSPLRAWPEPSAIRIASR